MKAIKEMDYPRVVRCVALFVIAHCPRFRSVTTTFTDNATLTGRHSQAKSFRHWEINRKETV